MAREQDQDQLVANEVSQISRQPSSPILNEHVVVRTVTPISTNQLQNQDIEQNPSESISSIERPHDKATSQWSALFLAVNVTVGAGLLAMPYSFQSAGLITSLVIQIFILIIVIGTCIIVTFLTARSGAKSYHQLVEIYCSRTLYNICNVFILLFSFGASIAFIVVVGDQFDRAFATRHGPDFCHTWFMNRRFTMTSVAILMIAPMCYSKTIDFLKYASSVGVVSLLFVAYVVFAQYFDHSDDIKVDINYYPQRWTDLFLVFPVFCLGYQSHLSWVPVAASLPRSDKVQSCITITIAMIISAILYTSISTVALLTFGNQIKPDLMENYSGGDLIVISAIITLALKSVLTYPIVLFPARIAIDDILCSYSLRASEMVEPLRRSIIASVWILLSLLIALVIPDILVAISLLGCTASAFIFIYPGIFWLQYIYKDKYKHSEYEDRITLSGFDKFRVAFCSLCIVFGTFLFGFILVKSVQSILEPQGGSKSICV